MDLIRFFLVGTDPIYPLIKESFSIIPLAAALLALLALKMWWKWIQANHASFRTQIWISFVFFVALQWGLRLLGVRSVYAVVRNSEANSFFDVARTYSVEKFLGEFLSIRHTLPLHATANMPGKTLFYHLLLTTGVHESFYAFAALIFSSLGGMALAFLFYQRTRSTLLSLITAMFYWLHPGKLYFQPLLNTVTPTLMIVNLLCWVWFLDKRQFGAAYLMGLTLFIVFLFEPLPLVAGTIHIALLVESIRKQRPTQSQWVRGSVGICLGFFGLYLLFRLVWRFDILSVFLELFRVNQSYYQAHSQKFWVIRNVVDFASALGLGTVFLFILNFRRVSQNREWLSWNTGFFMMFLALNLLGVTRAEEVGRLWIFVAALFAPVVVSGLRFGNQRELVVLKSCVAMNLIQSTFALFHIGFIWWN